MTRKKNGLMTFLWSLIPGAGEMYLGFLKRGASLMGTFACLIALAGFLQIELFLLLLPVIWFYSFFETSSLNSLPDDEFYAMEDDFILHQEDFVKARILIQRHRSVTAAALIFLGCSILWNILQEFIYRFLMPWIQLSDQMLQLLQYLGKVIPQAAVGILIIWGGCWLIWDKKKKLDL